MKNNKYLVIFVRGFFATPILLSIAFMISESEYISALILACAVAVIIGPSQKPTKWKVFWKTCLVIILFVLAFAITVRV
jgi:hypothetical protein